MPSSSGSSMRLGLTVPLWPTDVRRSCELAREAEDLGYTDAWSAETSGADGLAMATAAGVSTSTMTIGCAVVPAYTRPPALMAMGALAASQASGGRFCLGIGASSPTIVERWMGRSFDRPLAQVRETLTTVRSILSGEKTSFEGDKVSVTGFKLDAPADIPLYLAALGPRMLELAAAEADGVALFLASEEGVRIARRAAPSLPVMERILCCPDEPREGVRDIARWQLTPYLAVPAYNRFVSAQGFEGEAAAVSKAWGEGDRTAAREAITDELVDALVLSGPAEACKERLGSMREAGLDVPVLMFFSAQGAEGTEAAVRRMAPD